MQPTRPTSAAYTQPSGIRAIPAAHAKARGHTQPSSTGPADGVQNHIYAIFHDIYSKADNPPKAKMKAFLTMLKGPALANYSSNIDISNTAINFNKVRYSIKRKWIKWDKTQDEIDESKIGVG